MSKIVEVNFGDRYVNKPHNRHNTNRIRLAGHDLDASKESDVDEIREGKNGIHVSKVFKGKRHFKMYPWPIVVDVTYEPEELPKPKEPVLEEDADASAGPGKFQVRFADEGIT